MKNIDPIEELFQKRNKESVGEKPRDLVWKRIERELNHEKKKTKTLFPTIWFSAAAITLIAISYSIFYITTSKQNKNIEITKTNSFSNKQIQKEKLDNLDIIKKNKNPIVIVKNNARNPITKSNERINKITAPKDVFIFSKNDSEGNNIFDSLESKDLYAVNSKIKSNNFYKKDSINLNNLENCFSVASAYSEQKDDHIVLSKASAKIDINNHETKIIYDPLKFRVESKTFQKDFYFTKKTKKKVYFVQDSIIIRFKKSNNNITLKVKKSNLSLELVDILEKNKIKIYDYYQSVE